MLFAMQRWHHSNGETRENTFSMQAGVVSELLLYKKIIILLSHFPSSQQMQYIISEVSISNDVCRASMYLYFSSLVFDGLLQP